MKAMLALSFLRVVGHYAKAPGRFGLKPVWRNSTHIKGDEPFLNGSAFGNASNPKISKDISITLKHGTNKIDLWSLAVGLKNYDAFFGKTGAGSTGPVELEGLKSGSIIDLSSQRWTYQIGLRGESQGLETGGSALWVSGSPKGQLLTWYKTNFEAPSGDGPLVIDFTGMTKGEAWVNGQGIGCYWPGYNAPTGGCSKGGDPKLISFRTQELESLCFHVFENHPLPIEAWSQDKNSKSESKPRVSLECPHPNQVISSIKYASFGTPQGKCGSFSHGECRSTNALSILQKVVFCI
nr:beta-galactosidase 8 [Tanacetum cinerariifolium]